MYEALFFLVFGPGKQWINLMYVFIVKGQGWMFDFGWIVWSSFLENRVLLNTSRWRWLRSWWDRNEACEVGDLVVWMEYQVCNFQVICQQNDYWSWRTWAWSWFVQAWLLWALLNYVKSRQHGSFSPPRPEGWKILETVFFICVGAHGQFSIVASESREKLHNHLEGCSNNPLVNVLDEIMLNHVSLRKGITVLLWLGGGEAGIAAYCILAALEALLSQRMRGMPSVPVVQ